jgi:hypothetical protein
LIYLNWYFIQLGDIFITGVYINPGYLLQVPGMATLETLLKPAVLVGIQVNIPTALRALGLLDKPASFHAAPPYAKFLVIDC